MCQVPGEVLTLQFVAKDWRGRAGLPLTLMGRDTRLDIARFKGRCLFWVCIWRALKGLPIGIATKWARCQVDKEIKF